MLENRPEDFTDAMITENEFQMVAFFMNIRELDYEGVFRLIRQTNYSALEEYL
jgi:hypothetical protein